MGPATRQHPSRLGSRLCRIEIRWELAGAGKGRSRVYPPAAGLGSGDGVLLVLGLVSLVVCCLAVGVSGCYCWRGSRPQGGGCVGLLFPPGEGDPGTAGDCLFPGHCPYGHGAGREQTPPRPLLRPASEEGQCPGYRQSPTLGLSGGRPTPAHLPSSGPRQLFPKAGNRQREDRERPSPASTVPGRGSGPAGLSGLLIPAPSRAGWGTARSPRPRMSRWPWIFVAAVPGLVVRR